MTILPRAKVGRAGGGRTTKCRRKRTMGIPPGSANLSSAGVLLSCFSLFSFLFLPPSFLSFSLTFFLLPKGWCFRGLAVDSLLSNTLSPLHLASELGSVLAARFLLQVCCAVGAGLSFALRFVLVALDCSTRLDNEGTMMVRAGLTNLIPKDKRVGTLSLLISFVVRSSLL